MAIILIAIGLLLTGIDIHATFGVFYPAFHVSGNVGSYELSPSIQIFTTHNILTDQVLFDYLPDVLGCILILIGISMLLKHNKQYIWGMLFSVTTMILCVLLRASGFIEQGPKLVVWVLVCYFLLTASELIMEFFVVYATAGITDTLVNRSSNTRMLFGWWITVFCRVFMAFLTFVGHFNVKKGYQVVLALATIFYLYHLIRSRKYVGECETLKIGSRRKREKKEKL